MLYRACFQHKRQVDQPIDQNPEGLQGKSFQTDILSFSGISARPVSEKLSDFPGVEGGCPKGSVRSWL